MAKVSPIQTNFTGGIFSAYMDGHIDSPRRNNSYKSSINLIPMMQGPLTRRGGTRFVYPVKNQGVQTALVPFQFNVQQAYMLEVGVEYIRFYKDHGIILDSGVPYEVATPYSFADLFTSEGLLNLQYAQSADVLYLVHEDHKPKALARTGDTNWTLTDLEFEDGPYLPTNTTETTLTFAAGTGSVTVTASSVVGINGGLGFLASDVGRVIRVKQNYGSPAASGWHWGYISARASTTQITVDIKETSFTPAATKDWRLGVYSDTTGYPSVVTFYEGRIVFGASPENRQRIDFSTSGGFSPTVVRYSPTDTDATINPDNAIGVTISTTNYIQWLAGDEKGLVVGTAGGEWMVRPSINGEALSPDNSSAKPTSREGCAKIQPIETGSTILFAQRYRRKVNEHAYSFEVDSYRAPDMTLLAKGILGRGVKSWAWQSQPNRMAWCATTGGGLAALTYNREEQIIGWSSYRVGGHNAINAADETGLVDCVASIPNPSSIGDEVWMIVYRVINGSVKRYVEYMTPSFEIGDVLQDHAAMDSTLSYNGAPTATLTGLDHLEGEDVVLMVDGRTHPPLTVSGGSVTLANGVTGSVIHVGLKNSWLLRTNKWEAGAQDGTAQGKIKRFSSCIVRLLNSLGLKYGIDNVDEYVFDNAEGFDQDIGLFTGDIKITWPDGYDRAGELQFSHDGVYPVTIQALMPRLRTQDG